MKKLLIASALVGGLLMGCDKTDPFNVPSATPAQKSLVDLVQSDKNFARLNQAVAKAGLQSSLGGTNFTLFAPDNAAFAAAGLDSAAIAQSDPAALANILKYHVLNAVVHSSDLPTTVNKETATLNGTAYVSKFDFGTPAVTVNGAHVTLSDIAATNGVVHIIDNVLMPPAGSLVDVVNSNPALTFLKAAIARAGVGAALAGAGPLTVFAPTDDAFKTTSPYKTLDQINAAAPADLAAILNYHVMQGRLFSTNFVPASFQSRIPGSVAIAADPDSAGIATLAGGRLAVNGDLKVLGSGNYTKDANGKKLYDVANITKANQPASNGVVHLIDRVLLPK